MLWAAWPLAQHSPSTGSPGRFGSHSLTAVGEPRQESIGMVGLSPLCKGA